MKIVILILSITIYSFLPMQKIFFVKADTTYFARIIYENTLMYSSPDALENSAIFTLPQTYFVELISATNGFYYAKYKDIYGYVKKDQVQAVIGSPQTPFLTGISFRVFTPSGANLRSTPQNLGATNLIYSIPFLETNLEYYGTISGEEAISKKGCIWYYCKYYLSNLSYMGYVYSPLCDCLSPIPQNTENLEIFTGELSFKEESAPTQTAPLETLSPTAQSLIIVAVSLPCLLFIYLLFKPTKIAESAKESKSKKNRHKKISRLKRSDYFELDDDFS